MSEEDRFNAKATRIIHAMRGQPFDSWIVLEDILIAAISAALREESGRNPPQIIFSHGTIERLWPSLLEIDAFIKTNNYQNATDPIYQTLLWLERRFGIEEACRV